MRIEIGLRGAGASPPLCPLAQVICQSKDLRDLHPGGELVWLVASASALRSTATLAGRAPALTDSTAFSAGTCAGVSS